MAREKENSSAVLEGKAGVIGPVSCLEWVSVRPAAPTTSLAENREVVLGGSGIARGIA